MLIFISRKCLRLYVVCCYSFDEGDDWGILDNEEVVLICITLLATTRFATLRCALWVRGNIIHIMYRSWLQKVEYTEDCWSLLVRIEKVPQYRGTDDLFGSRGVHRLDTHIVGVYFM